MGVGVGVGWSKFGRPTTATVRQFRRRSQRTFLFSIDPLTNGWGSRVLSPTSQDWPPYGAPLVMSLPFSGRYGWLKNLTFWVTSNNPQGLLGHCCVIIW